MQLLGVVNTMICLNFAETMSFWYGGMCLSLAAVIDGSVYSLVSSNKSGVGDCWGEDVVSK